MRLLNGAAALERVKIPRFGWSLPAAGLLSLAVATAGRAQDVRADQPATHTVKRGDTLWDLAKTYLGDSYLWPSIYRINTDQIEDPHWIYPGEILRLPGGKVVAQAAPTAEAPPEAPRSRLGPTVFTPRSVQRATVRAEVEATPTRVPIGDVMRATYLSAESGPRGSGRILYAADIPGIDKRRWTTNFAQNDQLLMIPPVGSVAAERERFIAYELAETIEGVGTVVVPTALLQVTRSPRNGEAATVQVLELYGMLNADARVVPLDTSGTGGTSKPMVYSDSRTAKVRSIQRPAILPSVGYEILFDLSSKDGMKVGDEVQLFHAREKAIDGEHPVLPEVVIAYAHVVRVTPNGSTARITWQDQPAIRIGETVRVTARMP
jgi:hypothetical protein